MASDIHKSIWTYQRRVFSFPNYPDLLLTYWGSYKVHHTRLRRYMLKFFTLHRKGKVSTEVLRDIITRYWPIYKVVLANYYKKMDKKWRKKNE